MGSFPCFVVLMSFARGRPFSCGSLVNPFLFCGVDELRCGFVCVFVVLLDFARGSVFVRDAAGTGYVLGHGRTKP